MATATPNWTDNVSVIAAATLAAGNKTRGTIDLRSKFGAFLFVRLGRKGSTNLAEVELLYQDSIFKARGIKDYRYSKAWEPEERPA